MLDTPKLVTVNQTQQLWQQWQQQIEAIEDFVLACWEKDIYTVLTSTPGIDKMLGRWISSNALAENAIRPFAVGRRAWLFADTSRGARASATCYNLVETAKTNGLEPYAYLRHVLAHIAAADTTEKLKALPPWNRRLNAGQIDLLFNDREIISPGRFNGAYVATTNGLQFTTCQRV